MRTSKRAYDMVTRIMTLDDGTKFINLTYDQVLHMLEWNPECKVWTTVSRYITDLDTDLYEGRGHWDRVGSTFRSRQCDIEHRIDQAYCIPLDKYNHPDWGEYTP